MHYLLPYKDLVEEITNCDHLIKEIYATAQVNLPKRMLYRPGCGLFNQKMIDLAKSFGYELTLGSVYPNDPIIKSPTINYLYLKYHIEDGDIVIVHDRKWTAAMLKSLQRYMKENKFESVTVETLLN